MSIEIDGSRKYGTFFSVRDSVASTDKAHPISDEFLEALRDLLDSSPMPAKIMIEKSINGVRAMRLL